MSLLISCAGMFMLVLHLIAHIWMSPSILLHLQARTCRNDSKGFIIACLPPPIPLTAYISPQLGSALSTGSRSASGNPAHLNPMWV